LNVDPTRCKLPIWRGNLRFRFSDRADVYGGLRRTHSHSKKTISQSKELSGERHVRIS